MSHQILLVDDDALLRRSLAFTLEQAGYRVSSAASAEDALGQARLDPPDLVLLDVGLPQMDGFLAIRYFQDEFGMPVIFLTARRRTLDELLGLELGADDYVTKPFDVDVLLARIRAVLRRAEVTTGAYGSTPLVIGDMTIDPTAHTVVVGGQPVGLRPREFALLHVLALHAGQVVPLEELLTSVWGAEFVGEAQVVYVHIRWLRQKIEEDPSTPRRIITVHGVGYRLEAHGHGVEATP